MVKRSVFVLGLIVVALIVVALFVYLDSRMWPMTIISTTPVAIAATKPHPPDEMQKQLIQKAINAKRKLAQDQAVQSTRRAQLLQDHMRMMNDSMSQMQTARLRAGVSVQKQDEWFVEHQKFMDAMMGQMRDCHLALTQVGCW